MLSYFAHLPNSVVILPSLSKEKAVEFSKILTAVKKVCSGLIEKRIDTAVIFIPSGEQNSPGWTIIANCSPTLTTDFSALGDFSTKAQIKGESVLAARIMRDLYPRWPLKLETRPAIKNSDALLATLLDKKFAGGILTIFLPALEADALIDFGQALRDCLETAKERIAIVSSGDLGRSPSSAANDEFVKVDRSLVRALEKNNLGSLAGKVEKFRLSQATAIAPLLVLLAMTDGLAIASPKITYEQKFGVGLLVASLGLE